MKNILFSVLTNVAKVPGRCDTWGFKEPYGFYYQVNGFSKSGSVKLYEQDKKVLCEARYNEIYEITCFDDLVRVAFEWFENYRDRDVFSEPSELWVEDFVRLGLVKKSQKTVYEVI